MLCQWKSLIIVCFSLNGNQLAPRQAVQFRGKVAQELALKEPQGAFHPPKPVFGARP